MGLFDVFRKKQEVLSVNEREMRSFFEQSVQERFGRLNSQIQETTNEIKYHARKIKEYLKELETEGLVNPNIPVREFQIMQGNRENYIKRLRLFADSIIIPESIEEIEQKCSHFFEEFESLIKDTQKNFFVLKQFFDVTVTKIMKKLTETEKLYIQLKQLLEKENVRTINEIRTMFNDVEKQRNLVDQLKEKKKFYESEIDILETEKQKILEKVKSLQQSQDFRFYQQFLSEKAELEDQEQKEKAVLREYFSELERGLKKFSRVSTDEEIIKPYLANAIEALMDDEHLKIESILQKLRKEVEKGKIELKDKQKENILEIIDKMDKAFLSEKRKKLLYLKKEKEENMHKMNRNAIEFRIREQETYAENLQRNIEERQQKLDGVENEIERTNPNLILQQIAKKIGEFTNREIKWKRS